MGLLHEPWFVWGSVVVVGLPVLSIVLAEVQRSLERRGSPMTRPVRAARTWLLPLAGLVVLLAVIPDDIVDNDSNWFKVTLTVLGLLTLNFAITGLNTALFVNADRASWRRKLPTIFVDILRIVVIAIGLAVLFSWVWGADVGGLFTALGVTSIVLGLALQGALGSLVQGLLLLFEQPFQLGDWLRAEGATGQVVEVNWRAVHIKTADGLRIVPTASLAGSAFTNLSRPEEIYTETIRTTFTREDSPTLVRAVLLEVASSLPGLESSRPPKVEFLGSAMFTTTITVASYGEVGEAKSLFLQRLWYASRRHDLALDRADITRGESADAVRALLAAAADRLHVDADQIDDLVPRVCVQRFAPGEVVIAVGQVPDAARWIAQGEVALVAPTGNPETSLLMTLTRGDLVGQSILTKQPAVFATTAATELTTLAIPGPVFVELARSNARLAGEAGRELDQRRRTLELLLAESSPAYDPARPAENR